MNHKGTQERVHAIRALEVGVPWCFMLMETWTEKHVLYCGMLRETTPVMAPVLQFASHSLQQHLISLAGL